MKYKKFLPLIIFLLGLAVLAGAYFFVARRGGVQEEEEVLTEIPLNERPVASLTPSTDGHWLKLKVEKLIFPAASLDYELLYDLPDGRKQGVPGTVSLEGIDEIERDLLLGSESAGRFRYDEGVEKGTLTLSFRNDGGKLIGRLSTEFSLLSNTQEITTPDAGLSITLNRVPSRTFIVTMQTFGIPAEAPEEIVSGPYGVFSSSPLSFTQPPEIVRGSLYFWQDSEWVSEVTESFEFGIFIGTSE